MQVPTTSLEMSVKNKREKCIEDRKNRMHICAVICIFIYQNSNVTDIIGFVTDKSSQEMNDRTKIENQNR